IGGPYSGTAGSAPPFTGSATHPSTDDTRPGFTYSWSFRDGGTPATAPPRHPHPAPGTHNVAPPVPHGAGRGPSLTLTGTATAADLQPPVQVLNRLPSDPLNAIANGQDIGGLMVVNGQLVGTDYAYYDAAGQAQVSHFVLSSLDLSTARVGGLYQVGNLGGG